MGLKEEDAEEGVSSYTCVLCVCVLSNKGVSGDSEVMTSTHREKTKNRLLLSPPGADGLDHE